MGAEGRASWGGRGEFQQTAAEVEALGLAPLGCLECEGSGRAMGTMQGGELCEGSAGLRCRIASSRGWERGVKVADEGDELGGDGNAREEQSHGGVNATGGLVCGIGVAMDIPGVDSA
jgi:hypothetical protein